MRRFMIEVSHLSGKKNFLSYRGVLYRAPVEGGAVPQFVGTSLIIEDTRPTHPKHQSYSYS